MKMGRTYLVTITGVHPNVFRSGETASVIGVRFCAMKAEFPGERSCLRLCYHAMWKDGYTDFIPAKEAEDPRMYKLWVPERNSS